MKTASVRLISIWFLFAVLLHGPAAQSACAENVRPALSQAQRLLVVIGKSSILETSKPAKRVSLADPDVADAMVLSPQQIYLTGKRAGLTNLTVWEDGRAFAIYDLEVVPDITRLKEKLHEILPNEPNISVNANHDSVLLSGTVSSPAGISHALAVAEPYACTTDKEHEDKGVKVSVSVNDDRDKSRQKKCSKVVNLLQVGGVQQVMLEVRVSEVQRSLLKKMGINFSFAANDGKTFGLTMLRNLTRPKDLPVITDMSKTGAFGPEGLINPTNPPGVTMSQEINGVLRFMGSDFSWTGYIDALKDEGLLKVLAEPTLITLSGQNAKFLAGGEFPIPVPQTWNVITIEYKEFGVALSFTPTVLNNGKISMQVAPEVSELDFSTAVSLAGFVIPGLTTRRVSTTIELGDGQSFAIAGLLKNELREQVQKFPVLGDIPVLGALFRSSEFRKNETELVVIVTPHLVKPLDTSKQILPSDAFPEPDDYEFYLQGKMIGKRAARAPLSPSAEEPSRPSMEGKFGHILP